MKSIVSLTYPHTGTHFLKKLLPEFKNVMSVIDPQDWVNDGLVPDYLYLQGWHRIKAFKNLKILHACDVNVVSAIRHPLRVYGTLLREMLVLRLSGLSKLDYKNEIKEDSGLKDMLVKYKKFLEHTISLRGEPNFYLVHIDQIKVMNPEDRIDAIMGIFRPLNLELSQGSIEVISKWRAEHSRKTIGEKMEYYNSIYEECLEDTFNGLNSCSELLKDLCDSDLVKLKHGYYDTVPFATESIRG